MEWPVTLSLELLTPAFLGGAGTPAGGRRLDPHMMLRPGSVRGVLRWWFRAAAAAVLRPVSGKKEDREAMVGALRAAEAGIFGDTARASTVILGAPRGGTRRRYNKDEPHRERLPGLRYLGYGLFEHASGTEGLVTPPALTLPLRLRAGARNTEHVLPLLRATLWLWLHLGGIGGRSRRGFGAVCLQNPGDLDWPPEIAGPAASHDELNKQLIAGIDWATNTMAEHLPALLRVQGSFHPVDAKAAPHPAIRTLDGIDAITTLALAERLGEEALEQAGRLFRDFRSTLRRRDLGLPPLPDYFAVKDSLQTGRPPNDVYRAAFGLPLPFYFRSLGGQRTTFLPTSAPTLRKESERSEAPERPSDGTEQKNPDRVASPLLFRVHRLAPESPGGTARHTVVLVNLAGHKGSLPLLGRDLRQQGGRGRATRAPDGRAIEDFIQWAFTQSERLAALQGRGGS